MIESIEAILTGAAFWTGFAMSMLVRLAIDMIKKIAVLPEGEAEDGS